MNVIKTIKNIVSMFTKLTDRIDNANSALIDWSDFAQHMQPYTSNKTGEIKTQIESRLSYQWDRLATFWHQQAYGNTATPGQGGNDYTPFNQLNSLEASLAEKEKQLEEAGLSKTEMHSDMGFAGLAIRTEEARRWFAYCVNMANAYREAYEELNGVPFVYEPYQEKPHLQQAASSTKTLLQMITNK